MPMTRLMHRGPLSLSQVIELEGDVHHQLSRVHKLQPGESIQMFNGEGGCYTAIIRRIDKKIIRVYTTSFDPNDRVSAFAIHLGQALLRSEAMDWALQKATELGVASITPIITARSQRKIHPDRVDQKMNHWQRVMEQACCQCGRNRLPVLHSPVTLADWLVLDDMPTICCHTHGGRSPEIAGSMVRLLTGCEFGWSVAELDMLQDVACWQMGPRTLRAETASMMAVGLLQHRYGDL